MTSPLFLLMNREESAVELKNPYSRRNSFKYQVGGACLRSYIAFCRRHTCGLADVVDFIVNPRGCSMYTVSIKFPFRNALHMYRWWSFHCLEVEIARMEIPLSGVLTDRVSTWRGSSSMFYLIPVIISVPLSWPASMICWLELHWQRWAPFDRFLIDCRSALCVYFSQWIVGSCGLFLV